MIHHLKGDQSKNFGFCLSFWDRIFKCFCNKIPKNNEIGLENFDHPSKQGVWTLLKQPFINYKQ